MPTINIKDAQTLLSRVRILDGKKTCSQSTVNLRYLRMEKQNRTLSK